MLALMSKNFYLYSNRDNPNVVGRATFVSGLVYLAFAVLLFIGAFMMIGDNTVQYTVQFNKMRKV